MNDCLFCKIVAGEVPADKVFENDHVLGFKDLYPQAKIHYLFIHKSHSKDIREMDSRHISDVFEAIKQFSKESSLDDGFRIVTNIGKDGGQTIFHTHFHLLGGETLGSFGKN